MTTCCLGFFIAALACAQDEPPRSTDPRLKIELFAEAPQVVTPTGIDVDSAGRVWVIESNTHFPPEGYKGHSTDRILVMNGRDNTGKAESISVFKDGLIHSMSVAVKPVWLDIGPRTDAAKTASNASGKRVEVFIATRREIVLCTDNDGDLKCDELKQLIRLETSGNYPHNGLAGFAFDALGNMFFGFGENLGADYKIIGSDGTTLAGGGEGGNVYRCRPDGSKLERWATGFWNPHASCIDAFGRMFTLDNDPDSRPPCRLLHIIPGGDYGYRFRNGRKGTHPFTSWNGEIPGTLPMVSGTGEAPSGLVCYESTGFPEDYLGTLLVGSWGDHRIDKFVLKPRGVSFESIPHPMIKGGEDFRPVGLAIAPDGSLYVTDWVSKEYKLHGLGRVWRISSKDERAHDKTAFESVDEMSDEQRIVALEDRRLPVRRHVARNVVASEKWKQDLKKAGHETKEPESLKKMSLRAKYELVCAGAVVTGAPKSDGPFGFPRDEPVYRDLVDAAYLRLVDPTYGIVGDQDVWFWRGRGSWERLLVTEEGTQIDPSVILELSRIVEPHFIFVGACMLGLEKYIDRFPKYLNEPDPFVFSVLIERAVRESESDYRDVAANWNSPKASEGMRLLTVLAARRRSPAPQQILRLALSDVSPRVRRAAVQWAGEEKLIGFRPAIEKVLASEPMTGDLFLACLASLSMLDGVPPAEFEKAPPVEHILPIVKDSKRPAPLRAIALRILPPTSKEMDGKLLAELVGSNDEALRRESVRTLQFSPVPERDDLLRNVAANESLDVIVRADAVAGLAGTNYHDKLSDATRELLINLASRDKSLALRLEAIRSLRGLAIPMQDEPTRDARVTEALKRLTSRVAQENDTHRNSLSEALEFAVGPRRVVSPQQLLAQIVTSEEGGEQTVKEGTAGDRAESGRRTFFHLNGAGCFKCHSVGGRGGQVGPDLTVIARTMDRKKLAESILNPNKEISPQFTTWVIETIHGKVLTGMLLGEEVNGDLRLGNSLGEVFFVPFNEIETRSPTKTSIMPERLHEAMTASEFYDLLAYLETLK